MGQLVCMGEADAVRARDADMMARRARDGDPRGTPPLPRLTGGCLSDADVAGTLFPQSDARLRDGTAGRLDDLLGGGFWLITSRTPSIETPALVTLARIGIELLDAEEIALWLAAARAEAVLVRPDRMVFGVGQAGTLLAMLEERLGLAALVA
jgi:3-(3-hydroxy-phenyl)propionate hydroxylase